jgi:hypothetical protein
MLTAKGKNHGLILLLDKSGSMSENMSGSIEQILVLAMFCRKVNIPFAVYGFGNNTEVYMADMGITYDYDSKSFESKVESFQKADKDVAMSNVRLREYINSSMSNAEFSRALRNCIVVKKSFMSHRHGGIRRPVTEHLSNTPLNEALIATAELMKEFKKKNNLDLTSLVIVHDGESDSIDRYWFKRNASGEYIQNNFDQYSYNVIVRDDRIKFQHKLEKREFGDITLKWFKQYTGCKVSTKSFTQCSL